MKKIFNQDGDLIIRFASDSKDREEELYYNERKVRIYDAYILGYNDAKKETTELLTTLHKDIRNIS